MMEKMGPAAATAAVASDAGGASKGEEDTPLFVYGTLMNEKVVRLMGWLIFLLKALAAGWLYVDRALTSYSHHIISYQQ